MMGQVWNLHTPLLWLISARLGSVTHYLLVEVRENVGDRHCESASVTVYSTRPKYCLGGSEMCTKKSVSDLSLKSGLFFRIALVNVF